MPPRPLRYWTRCLCLAAGLVAAFATTTPLANAQNRGRLARNPRADLERFQKQHAELHAAFARQLEELAQSCEAQNLSLEASEIRKLAEPVDTRTLQMDPLPSAVQLEIPLSLPAHEREWRTRLRKYREDYAKELYLLSRRVLSAGYVSYAYDLVREVALQDSDHSAARRLLGYERLGNEWVTPFAAYMLRRKHVWHDTFGWLPQDHVERYEKGERYLKPRWISAAQEAEIRRDFEHAWEIRTDHYRIRTNHSLETGVELGKQLEDFYRIFFQTFAGFFNTRDQLQRLFSGTDSRSTNRMDPFEIHYYRSRDEYNQRLRSKIAQPIEITTGLYLSGDRVAYFFDDPSGDAEARTTLFHEATHQLFAETRPSRQSVGMRGNFWIIEGIACYMESFQRHGSRFSLGNPEYIRFRAAQYRYVTDNYYIPLRKFAAMGMNEFQSDMNISKNYSQASGLAHFFMHYDGGIYREALIEHLSDIYSLNPRVRDNPRSLETLTGVEYEELDRQYGEYISQLATVPSASEASTLIPTN